MVMPRFKTRAEGFASRKPVWVCKDCGTQFQTADPRKTGGCSQCRGREFHYFPSRREFRRYKDLLLLQLAGKIAEIELQPAYDLTTAGVKFTCKADFRYRDKETGRYVVEDVKSAGTDTNISRLKRAMVKERYGVDIVIIN